MATDTGMCSFMFFMPLVKVQFVKLGIKSGINGENEKSLTMTCNVCEPCEQMFVQGT